MKILYIDCETTGLNHKHHDIIQFSGIIEIDGVEKKRFDFKICPEDLSKIDLTALTVNNLDLEKIKTFMPARQFYKELMDIFDQFIDKYDPTDKFLVCGYNVRFDIDFLNEFFKKNNNEYLFSYLQSSLKDPYPIFGYLKAIGKINPENLKLNTICSYFGIQITAHNAMSDILATKELIKILDSILEQVKYERKRI